MNYFNKDTLDRRFGNITNQTNLYLQANYHAYPPKKILHYSLETKRKTINTITIVYLFMLYLS